MRIILYIFCIVLFSCDVSIHEEDNNNSDIINKALELSTSSTTNSIKNIRYSLEVYMKKDRDLVIDQYKIALKIDQLTQAFISNSKTLIATNNKNAKTKIVTNFQVTKDSIIEFFSDEQLALVDFDTMLLTDNINPKSINNVSSQVLFNALQSNLLCIQLNCYWVLDIMSYKKINLVESQQNSSDI